MLTISVIKADIGGYVGHSSSHPEAIAEAQRACEEAKKSGLLIDFHVTWCGDDLQLIMTHERGVDNEAIHKMAWETFERCTEVARKLKLYGAGQDLLSDAFSGNIKGMGPGVAEMEIQERTSEPVIVEGCRWRIKRGTLLQASAPEMLDSRRRNRHRLCCQS